MVYNFEIYTYFCLKHYEKMHIKSHTLYQVGKTSGTREDYD